MEGEMELRHLRYFIAVAEEGSLTLAAEKRLHTAQPSLSRQIRDLEYEVGVPLMIRSVHGIELTAAGRAFLDHARLALTQAEEAAEAARRAAQLPRTLFAIGFLTGYEMDWLPAVMEILRAELPSTEVVIHSQDSPDLAAGLIRGKIDLAFLRPEKQAPGLKFKLLRKDPLIVVMPRGHALAARSSIRPQDIAGRTFIGVSPIRADPVGCHQRLRQAFRRETRPSGREPGNGDFAGGVHRRHRPVSALFAKPAAENRRQPTDTRCTANGRPGHRLQRGEHVAAPKIYSRESG
jgi:DNA-binding transcriptional LysR family regulator